MHNPAKFYFEGNARMPKVQREEEEEEEELEQSLLAEDAEDDEAPGRTKLITKYIKMWPRGIFDEYCTSSTSSRGRKKSLAANCDELDDYGVYVLYRDDRPYYIGQAKTQSLFKRLATHATHPNSRRYLFWNYFSAYIVDPKHVDEMESILITAMPSVLSNGAIPRLPRVKMQGEILELANRSRKERKS